MKLKDLFEMAKKRKRTAKWTPTNDDPRSSNQKRSTVLSSANDPAFRKRVEKAKKGKASYTRKEKYKSQD